MNRYILIHRLTGPAILLLLGIVALLSEMHVVHFALFVPLLLILLGVLKLAERAALAGYEYPAPGAGPQHACGGVINGPGSGAGPGPGGNYGAGYGPGAPPQSSGSIAPAFHELAAGSESRLPEAEEGKQ